MKIIFGGETKRVPEMNVYEELIRYSSEVFRVTQEKCEDQLKLYYLDEDGDIISVSCQSDLDEAMRLLMGRIKLAMAYSKDEASHCLLKGSFASCDSFLRSDSILSQSLAEKTAVTRVNSDLSAASKNVNSIFNFEMFLQNQIERTVRQMEPEPADKPMRSISGNYILDYSAQPKSSCYPQARPLDPAKIQAIEEGSEEKSLSTVSTRQIDEIVRELDGPAIKVETEEEAKQDSPDLDEQVLAKPCRCDNGCERCRSHFGEAAPASEGTGEPSNGQVAGRKASGKKEVSLFRRKCICKRGLVNPKCVKCYLKKVFEPRYGATCVGQPADGIELAGAKFIAQWTFRNSGAITWPKDVQFKQVGGDELKYSVLDAADLCVEAQGEVQIAIGVQVPSVPGSYHLAFSLAHSGEVSFGDVVALNLISKIEDQYSLNKTIDEELLSESEEHDPQDSDEATFKFQKNEEDSLGSSSDEELSVESWIMVDEQEDYESACQQQEEGHPAQMVAYEPVPAETEETTQLTEIETFKYTKKMNNRQFDDRYKDNLIALMNLGFADFEANLEALQRNGNRFDPTVSSLLELVE